jgi:hypothetical protein
MVLAGNDKPNEIIDGVAMLYYTIVVVFGYFLVLVPTFSAEGVYLERPWKSGSVSCDQYRHLPADYLGGMGLSLHSLQCL